MSMNHPGAHHRVNFTRAHIHDANCPVAIVTSELTHIYKSSSIENSEGLIVFHILELLVMSLAKADSFFWSARDPPGGGVVRTSSRIDPCFRSAKYFLGWCELTVLHRSLAETARSSSAQGCENPQRGTDYWWEPHRAKVPTDD